jgi:hypothetical protein
MEKLYVLKNFRAWGALPEDDYDRTYYEAKENAVIHRAVDITKLAQFVNDAEEMNTIIHFLALDNFEQIMGWLGENELSINEMQVILNLEHVDEDDITTLVYQREFPEYANKQYKAAKEVWETSFKQEVHRIVDKYGFTDDVVSFLTDCEYTTADERFFDGVHKAADVEKKENNRYYRNAIDEVRYGIVRLADDCLSAATKRKLVGSKFDKFIMWAALAADNEVVDKFIYENKGTYKEKRHYYDVTIRNFVMNGNMCVI